jgi:thioredoxin reductase
VVADYLGFPSGVSDDELASRALQQARRLGAEILVTRAISRIDAEQKQLHLDGGDLLRGPTIILACVVAWRHLAIEGFDRLAGKTEVIAAHGDSSLEGIDISDAATGHTTHLDSGGLFIFIGADAETAWLPPEIALDQKGYVLTGPDLRVALQTKSDRDRCWF